MKNFSLLITAVLFALCINSFGQGSDGFNYQAVVRDDGGNIIANQNVSYRLTILEGSASGTEVYSEDHSVSTDSRGLVNMVIGTGSGPDDFSAIDWGSSSYFLEVELDETGGNSYTSLGTSEFNSVPYAFHAQTASDVDDADADPVNEIQSLSISGNNLSISDGNSVTLPSSSGDSDSMAKAWAHVSILGSTSVNFDAYNVISSAKTTTGVYVVNLNSGLFGSPAANPSVLVTLHNDLAPGVAVATYSASPSQITVRTYDMNGNLSDRGFNILVFGD